MAKLRLNLVIDEVYIPDSKVFYLYRSQEGNESQEPIVSGLYIRQETVGEIPPKKMVLLLEWK